MNTEKECSKWTDSQIITYVMSQVPDGLGMNLTINNDESEHVGAVVDYNGPDGVVAIDGNFVVTGRSKSKSGVYLDICPKVYVMGEFSGVRWVRKVAT
ncbi:hypothetical protein QBC40DRAFT_271247 [Triangularia verruculosa]|uniref:Uncharacterized protein n=1 Tax=Triangularia verruculosa TaxID=2587418 RepID=A0AAN6XWW7_9PEZI|nr:hypothetical protein QBC40DRAFT_271247 [Triangularia verruculosa]